MPGDRIPVGTILATIPVGQAETCPPGKSCPGKIWSADFCAIFGERLERVGPGYRYRKCGECAEAGVAHVAAQGWDRQSRLIQERHSKINIFKGID